MNIIFSSEQIRAPGRRGLTLIAMCAALACASPSALAQAGADAVSSQAAAPFWQSVTVTAVAPATPVAIAAKLAATATASAQVQAAARKPALQLTRLHAATLDFSGMKSFTASAPRERAGAMLRAGDAGGLTIALPHPDGGFRRFNLVESSIMEPGLAARHPEIKTYRGVGIDDPKATLRLDITPLGLHASVRSPNGGFFVDPYYRGDTTTYASYGRADLVNAHGSFSEGTVNEAQLGVARSLVKASDSVDVHGSGFAPGAQVTLEVHAEGDAAAVRSLTASADKSGNITASLPAGSLGSGAYEIAARDSAVSGSAVFVILEAAATVDALQSGTQLRTYRLALVSDPSYAAYFGTQNVTAAKVTLMNRVTQVYEDETSIRLVLIDATDALNLDTDARMTGANGPCGGAACFTTVQASTCGSGTLSRNRVVAGLLAGASNYDIGHIALGLNGGGIASLGVVGASSKAQGCTGIPTPEGDFYAVDYVAHEMGHEFAGNHTFNGTISNCSTSNRNAGTSVEPGSGSSIMAYAGICGTDNLQSHSDPYWSERSFDEITTYTSRAETSLNEVQMGVLTNFATDGQQFQLAYNGNLSAPIVRGANYSVAGLQDAVAALTGGTVVASAVGDNAFTLTFSGTLAGTNIASLQVVNVTGGASGYVGEITAGGLTTRGGAVSATGNTTPVVSVPTGYTIPVRTPFALTGSGVDADGDELTYMWEQDDRGATGTRNGTGLISNIKLDGPLFRQFGTRAIVSATDTLVYGSPGENHTTSNTTRVFPDIAQILANNTNAETGVCPAASSPPTAAQIDCFSEYLPTAAYVGTLDVNAAPASLHFRLTARDGRGGINSATSTVVLAPGAGPFLVTSPNTAVSMAMGSTQVVTWNVANTSAAPVSAGSVRISLSLDGGLTFPLVLAESVPNSGSAPVVMPSVATTTARIKVEAVGNIFFDVSNTNFTLALPVAGDVDGDGVVGCSDLAILKAQIGKRSTAAGFDARADVVKDNVIDARDLLYVTQRVAKGTVCN
jgi:hypothetical protein